MILINDCYQCMYKRSIPGDCHLSCSNPDFTITGNEHGITQGWFFYPFNYDPIWMTSKCHNFSILEKNK